MKSIDFRFRPHTQDALDGIACSPMFSSMCGKIGFPSMKARRIEEIVQDLAEHNVVRAVVTGRDCETTYNAVSNNSTVIALSKRFPELFVGFAGVDPHKGMKGIYALTAAVKDHKIKGASIDPYLAKIRISDARYYPVYAKCCELAVPVIISTGPATLVSGAVMEDAAPRYIDIVARDFPDLVIIASHGGYPWVNEMIQTAQRNPNVYMDISEYELSPQSESYILAANSVIGDKILYASAHPFVDYRKSLLIYESLPFNDEVRGQVMYGNAARILGID